MVITCLGGHTGIPRLWTQVLDARIWTLDSGRWALDADTGRWTLDVKALKF